MQSRLLDELRAHHQVVVEEPPGVFLVVANAADHRRHVNHEVRIGVSSSRLTFTSLTRS